MKRSERSWEKKNTRPFGRIMSFSERKSYGKKRLGEGVSDTARVKGQGTVMAGPGMAWVKGTGDPPTGSTKKRENQTTQQGEEKEKDAKTRRKRRNQQLSTGRKKETKEGSKSWVELTEAKNEHRKKESRGRGQTLLQVKKEVASERGGG